VIHCAPFQPRSNSTWKIGIWNNGIYLFCPQRSGELMPKTIFTGANRVVVEELRRARIAAGLTQGELGAKLGKDQSHISLIEGSQRRLDLLEFREIALALGRDPVGLFADIMSKIA
jgi:DNA-binding XRE family transcriptional regulator